MASGNESNHRFDGLTVEGGLKVTGSVTLTDTDLATMTLGTDRGLLANSTTYEVGDVVTLFYAGSSAGYRRVLITRRVTSGSTGFISAGAYKPLTPRLSALNVMDFGALGNGATDDTAAIQSAIDQASSTAVSTGGGGAVMFPAGFYITSSTLVLKKHVWLMGEGQRSTTIKLATNANCDVIRSFDTGGASGNADYVGIINMCIDGNSANQNGAGPYHGIKLNTNPVGTIAAGDSFFDMHATIQNVTVYRAKGNGIDCTGRSAHQFYNCHLSQNTVNGFKSTFDITVVGCEADNNGSTGFNLNNGSIKLIGCKAYLNGSNTPTTDAAGFSIGSTGPGELVGCEAQNNYLAGYNFISADRINMAGCNADSNNMQNSVVDAERSGVSMVGSTNCLIDVVCLQGTQGGVQIGNQKFALHMDTTSSNNDVRMTNSAIAPATLTGDVTTTSVIGSTNNVMINGIRATPIQWGPTTGTLTADTNVYRLSADTLATDDDFALNTAGKGLRVKEGSNAKMGVTSAMTAGSITVSTTAVTASSRIFLTAQTTGGTPGALRVSARTAGTSFTITSTSGTDTSTVGWLIMEPA